MLNGYIRDERGTVTIDWVALTAGVLLVGITVVYSLFGGGVADFTRDLNSTMTAMDSTIDTGAAPSQATFQP